MSWALVDTWAMTTPNEVEVSRISCQPVVVIHVLMSRSETSTAVPDPDVLAAKYKCLTYGQVVTCPKPRSTLR